MKTIWLLIQADRRLLLSIGVGLTLINCVLGPLPDQLQWGYFIGSVLLTGIPHGALDHLVVAGTDARQHRAFSMTRFLTRYLLLMTLYALVWWQWPGLALLAFMLCSAYHFGETDLTVLAGGSTPADRLVFLSYGWLLVSFLALSHTAESLPIIAQLPGITVTPDRFISVVESANRAYSLGCGFAGNRAVWVRWLFSGRPGGSSAIASNGRAGRSDCRPAAAYGVYILFRLVACWPVATSYSALCGR
jgi:Brp/Blh family beta-carotene 15,15'-monooxygenase